MSGEDVSVTVAVRVRPFNEREINMEEKICVAMEGSTTRLLLPPGSHDPKGEKTFSFDYSFWSHDGFTEDDNGVYRAVDDRYATQEQVFDAIGLRVLDRAWKGYHCCLFAYGQTGAGKSYSMVGYGANPGIIPISCKEIFRRIDANKDPDLSYEVTVSMLEIYNEKVQDLLCNPKDRPQGGLEIRESKQLGIYVQGLAERAVDSYEAIERVVEQGTQNRTVASTLMNATSSRAHTVLCIDMKQVSRKGDLTGVKHSTTYLVDLAGSEKTSKTATSGDRLKEGCAINKSLTSLGNVIEKLADRSMGKNVTSIPYRDSKLTRLLQNALGGSCMTVMIVAISPARNNYDESLSTLRYADRAKKIKNVVVVNENPQDRLIRQLREENTQLLEMLEKQKEDAYLSPANVDLGSTFDAKQLEDKLDSERKRFEAEVSERAQEVKSLEAVLATMQQDFKQRVEESRKTMEKPAEPLVKDFPHFSNLHEDPQLTGKLHYIFPKDKEVVLGKKPIKKGDAGPDIILAGLGVYLNHCKVLHTEDGVFLRASQEAVSSTFVNGDNCALRNGEAVKLVHGDRVIFGQNYVFVFSEAKGETGEHLILHGKVSFDGAKKELCEKQGDIQMKSEEELKKEKARESEFERRLEAANAAKLKIQQDAEALIIEREREFREKMELMQQQFETLADHVDSDEVRREVHSMRSTRNSFFSAEAHTGSSLIATMRSIESSIYPGDELCVEAVDWETGSRFAEPMEKFVRKPETELAELEEAPRVADEPPIVAQPTTTEWLSEAEPRVLDFDTLERRPVPVEKIEPPPVEKIEPPPVEVPCPSIEPVDKTDMPIEPVERAPGEKPTSTEVSQPERQPARQAPQMKRAWAQERKIREKEWEAERSSRDLELKKMQHEFEVRQKNAEKEARRQLQEIERKSRILTEKAEERRMHDSDQTRINEQLLVVLPMVKEANAIAKELKKNISLQPQLWVEPDESGVFASEIRVSVVKQPEGVALFIWPMDTVENRLFLMRELLEQWCNNPSFNANGIPCEEDPFWDPLEERYLGCARLFLESLTWQLETEVEARVVSADGKLNAGSLQLELWPLDSNDKIGVKDADAVEYPDDLLASEGEMKFLLGINQYVGGSKELEAIRCRYQYRYHEPKSIGAEIGAVIDFKFEEIISEPTDADLLDFLTFTPVFFRLFGQDKRRRAVHEEWTQSLSLNAAARARHSLRIDPEDTVTTLNAGSPLWNPSSPNLDATLISVSPALWAPPSVLDESIVSVMPLMEAAKLDETIVSVQRLPSRPHLYVNTPCPEDLSVPEHNHSRTNLSFEMARIQEQLEQEAAENIVQPSQHDDDEVDTKPADGLPHVKKGWTVGGLLRKSSNKYKESKSKACSVQ